jgi:ATP-dependent DNA ligase
VGKTTLAAAYAERHRGDYRATWWIRAQTPIAFEHVCRLGLEGIVSKGTDAPYRGTLTA